MRKTQTNKELTERQIEIVRGIASSESPREIGARLGIHPNVVTEHMRNAMQKLGLRGVPAAVLTVWAWRNGLIEVANEWGPGWQKVFAQ